MGEARLDRRPRSKVSGKQVEYPVDPSKPDVDIIQPLAIDQMIELIRARFVDAALGYANRSNTSLEPAN